MTLTDLIAFLERTGAKPKKSLSQNFLIDSGAIEKIISLAEVQPTDSVLEIGPGPGALTTALLATGARVYAVELDTNFARELDRFQNGKLKVFETDILKFPIERLPPNTKIVANLPYHITTPILEKIFLHPFTTVTIMVQKEVADRMKAKEGSKTFGSLSIFVQFYSHIHSTFTVPATSFYPKPKVDSTVIRLDYRKPPDVDPKHFFSLVHKAFQQRRKMMTSSLDLPKEKVRETLLAIGARADARPESLSFDQWVQFAQSFPANLT
jgi:16S rRNA (adenine1518-N6/adenine1519-N6)-dimethyltransferase